MVMTVQDAMEKTEVIRNRFSRQVDEIRGNHRLTAEGIAEDLDAAYERAAAEVNEVKERYQTSRAARIADLQRQLFGHGTIAATRAEAVALDSSYRDALDRADRAQTEGGPRLMSLMERALRSGDDLQAKAAASVAIDSGKTDVLRVYVERFPETRDRLEELHRLQNPDNWFQEALAFQISKPQPGPGPRWKQTG